MEVLITSGGTEEPIDGVRTISNFSTGKTGATIAEYFYKSGFKVTLLASKRAIVPDLNIEIIRYQSFHDLNTTLKQLLETRTYTGVIHAAAVSDFSVDYLLSNGEKIYSDSETKIDSSKPLSIILKPNFKILNKLKSYSRNKMIVVGFKLTKNGSASLIKNKIDNLFKDNNIDYVIHNDLKNITETKHISTFYKNNKLFKECSTKNQMADTLLEIFKGTT